MRPQMMREQGVPESGAVPEAATTKVFSMTAFGRPVQDIERAQRLSELK